MFEFALDFGRDVSRETRTLLPSDRLGTQRHARLQSNRANRYAPLYDRKDSSRGADTALWV